MQIVTSDHSHIIRLNSFRMFRAISKLNINGRIHGEGKKFVLNLAHLSLRYTDISSSLVFQNLGEFT